MLRFWLVRHLDRREAKRQSEKISLTQVHDYLRGRGSPLNGAIQTEKARIDEL